MVQLQEQPVLDKCGRPAVELCCARQTTMNSGSGRTKSNRTRGTRAWSRHRGTSLTWDALTVLGGQRPPDTPNKYAAVLVISRGKLNMLKVFTQKLLSHK
ncbi:hypothetical protein J6590_040358 [Homalodisca vitripennis]|nr:hypothetical protein J6590_040358 [Homalodisca vitripennis]